MFFICQAMGIPHLRSPSISAYADTDPCYGEKLYNLYFTTGEPEHSIIK